MEMEIPPREGEQGRAELQWTARQPLEKSGKEAFQYMRQRRKNEEWCKKGKYYKPKSIQAKGK